jgi:D-alanyl-D-alanine carboxypeptidase
MSAAVNRRRTFAAIVALLLAIGGFVLLRSPRGLGAPGPSSPEGASARPTPDASASMQTADAEEMPPAWLAWISGSLPPAFAPRAEAMPALGTMVVIAGDTLWMRSSEDANGRTIDRPIKPYAIPIDAFSVDPAAYAPFIPEAFRDTVASALTDGKAVLGSSSAKLRRIHVGGTIDLATGSVEVGAIVPDDVAGWSELLVSQAEGDRLGIADDRYLLSMPPGAMTESRFADLLARLLPDTNVRTLAPGGSTYMRIASGVNPPVVMKQVFGEFAAHPQSQDPAFLTMSSRWYDAHIRTRTVPLLGRVTCNVALFRQLTGALRDVEAAGLGDEIHTYSGCYAARTVARSATAPPSEHAYGAAIDINAPENPYGAKPTMDPAIVRIFEGWGFLWGGNFLTPDGMHFEYGEPPGQASP